MNLTKKVIAGLILWARKMAGVEAWLGFCLFYGMFILGSIYFGLSKANACATMCMAMLEVTTTDEP